MGTNTKLTSDKTLNDLISVEPQAAGMLESIGLSPAEHGDETLRAVCMQRQWSEEEVLQWLKKHRPASHDSNTGQVAQHLDLGSNAVEWSNYLKEELHNTNLELLNEISKDFPRVLRIHGNQYPWLKNMKWHFEKFEEVLRFYFRFEQIKFFPLCRKLHESKGEVLEGTIRDLKRCVTIVSKDQKRLQNLKAHLYDKGLEFRTPSGACTTLRILNQNFKMLYSGLDEQFEVEKEKLLPLVQEKLNNS